MRETFEPDGVLIGILVGGGFGRAADPQSLGGIFELIPGRGFFMSTALVDRLIRADANAAE